MVVGKFSCINTCGCIYSGGSGGGGGGGSGGGGGGKVCDGVVVVAVVAGTFGKRSPIFIAEMANEEKGDEVKAQKHTSDHQRQAQCERGAVRRQRRKERRLRRRKKMMGSRKVGRSGVE